MSKPLYEDHCGHMRDDKKSFCGHSRVPGYGSVDVYFYQGGLIDENVWQYCLRFGNKDSEYLSGNIRSLMQPSGYSEGFTKEGVIAHSNSDRAVVDLFFNFLKERGYLVNP